MANVRILDQAQREFDAVVEYFERVGADAFAETFESRFIEIARRLKEFPRMGRIIPEIGDSSLREVIYKNYRIMYVVNDDASEVEILSILHSSQQFGGFPNGD